MHEHEVKDKDALFVIDEALNITGNPKTLKRGDHKSEILTFIMPKYFEGHDMSKCNVIEVHYDNVKNDKATRETITNSSFDEVQNIEVLEDKIQFEWLVKGDATQLDGVINFAIRFACITDGNIEYQKFTSKFEGVPVDATVFNTEQVTQEYADVLQEWKTDVYSQIGVVEEGIDAIIEAQEALIGGDSE